MMTGRASPIINLASVGLLRANLPGVRPEWSQPSQQRVTGAFPPTNSMPGKWVKGFRISKQSQAFNRQLAFTK